MAVYALTGKDSLIINNRAINNYSNGSTIEIAFQNDRIGTSTGKDDNTVISDNRQGGNAVLTLRLIRGSAEDIWFNGLSIEQDRDLPAFALLSGSYAKRIGDGSGNVTHDTYNLAGGVFQRHPDVQENLEGDTEQGTTVYQIFFSKVQRSLK